MQDAEIEREEPIEFTRQRRKKAFMHAIKQVHIASR
jgi:hypothetical protein